MDDKEAFWAWAKEKYPDWYARISKQPTEEDSKILIKLIHEYQDEMALRNLPKGQ